MEKYRTNKWTEAKAKDFVAQCFFKDSNSEKLCFWVVYSDIIENFVM